MTRLIVDDPELAEVVSDLAELIRPCTVATVGSYIVALTPLVGEGQ